MKTDDLIRAIVADNKTVHRPVGRTVTLAIAAGAIVAAVLFSAFIGARADFWWSIVHSPRFIFKFVFTLAIAVPAYLIVRLLARPDANPRRLFALLLIAPLGLAAAVLAEMWVVPRSHWAVYAIGSNAMTCMKLIPLLSLAPLAAVLYALRQGAPANPALAGAMGGLLSAAIAATLYASRCIDDSPLFVSIWYLIAIALVAAAGALIGARLLKW